MAGTKPFYNSVIPSDWTTPKFGSVFTFLKSFAFSRDHLTNVKTSDEIRNIHYGDIHATYENEILDFELEQRIPYLQDGFIDVEKFEDDEFPALKDGDLVIADASEDHEGICDCVELRNLNGAKVLSGLHTFAARGDQKQIAGGFRTYCLKHQQVIRELRRLATGISVYGVSKSNLSQIELALPPLPEQKAIAHVLGLMDSAINQNNQLIAQKELRKKWLMQNLLTGKKRLKGFTGEWKTQRLVELIKPVSRPVGKPKESFVALGIRSHGKGTFLKPDFQPEKIEMETLYVVRKNDLILNITFAWEGAVAIVGSNDDGALVSHRFPTFLFKEGKADVEFFGHFILQKRFKYLLGVISPGGAGRNRVLDKKDFLKMDFEIPDFDEQARIGQILSSADKEIQLLKTKIEKLREQKKGIMQQLLTGKKRLKGEGVQV